MVLMNTLRLLSIEQRVTEIQIVYHMHSEQHLHEITLPLSKPQLEFKVFNSPLLTNWHKLSGIRPVNKFCCN